ncbi:TIGR01440 family protein [Alicyclobacillus acidoterrestris]|uniref:TIGR01440 family protein n=1 Tax=Alicyclobacillus acidoterrestris TaxID=1450 RepID=UPI001F15DC90|nr:TIGR01440 family protein [Alicyclobacillus acidoterrestris]
MDNTCDEPISTGSAPMSADLTSGAAGAVDGASAVANGVGTSVADLLSGVSHTLRGLLDDLQAAANLRPGQMVVVGASSSEVQGQRIGTATSLAVGEAIVDTVLAWATELGLTVAFQCCEHLNRALVVSRSTAVARNLEEVSAVPVPGAGGAVAATAYFRLEDACLVRAVQADAGIDIGDTFIGMHLKPVVVPVRGRTRELGAAHVTMARTRPPLIGGARAVYDVETARQRLQGV